MLQVITAPWHIEYFKLKGFEKMAETGRLLWSPPTSPFSHRPYLKHILPIPRRKENPYLWEQRNSDKNPNTQALLSFLLFTTLISPSLSVIFIHISLSNSIKYSNLRKTFPSPFTHLPSFLCCHLNYTRTLSRQSYWSFNVAVAWSKTETDDLRGETNPVSWSSGLELPVESMCPVGIREAKQGERKVKTENVWTNRMIFCAEGPQLFLLECRYYYPGSLPLYWWFPVPGYRVSELSPNLLLTWDKCWLILNLDRAWEVCRCLLASAGN